MPAHGTMKDILGPLELEAMPKAFIEIYRKMHANHGPDFAKVMMHLQMAAVVYEASELLRDISPVTDRDIYKKVNYVPASMRKLAMQRAVQMNMFVVTEFKGDEAWERPSMAAAQ